MRTIGIALAVLCAAPAAAQSDTAAACPRPAEGAAVRIEASVRARELRVDAPGEARATVRACTPAGAVRVERDNLPDPVRPGTTYRDAGVRVRITADPVVACGLAAALAGTAPVCPPAAAPARP